MADGWRKIEHGLFESADGRWRIANPWKATTELRHRWLVAQRRSSGSGWCMHDGDHATLHDARAYVEAIEAQGASLDDADGRATRYSQGCAVVAGGKPGANDHSVVVQYVQRR